MQKILRSAGLVLGSALGAIGLSACDAEAPPSARVSPAVESEVILEDETLTSVVREDIVGVLRDRDPFSRARRLATLLPTLGPDTVSSARQVLEDPTLGLLRRSTEIELLLRYWATHQPEEASRWAVESSPRGFRNAAIFSALTLWAQVDPLAALPEVEKWANQADVKEAALQSMVLGWFAAGNPPELQKFIQALGLGMVRQRALSIYVRAFIDENGMEALMRWAESLPDDDTKYKMGVYRQVSYWATVYDLEAGIGWCEAHCDGPHGAELRNMIASAWIRNDPQAAVEWLSNAPEGREKDRTTRGVFTKWLRMDREAALRWVPTQLSGGELKPWIQPILVPYAATIAEDSPAEAIEWAERIENDNERQWALIQVARRWRNVDEAASEEWLLQSSLSEEDREKVRTAPAGESRPEAESPAES